MSVNVKFIEELYYDRLVKPQAQHFIAKEKYFFAMDLKYHKKRTAISKETLHYRIDSTKVFNILHLRQRKM